MAEEISALESEIAKAKPAGATQTQIRETFVSFFSALSFGGNF